jgi:hypothetical protein
VSPAFVTVTVQVPEVELESVPPESKHPVAVPFATDVIVVEPAPDPPEILDTLKLWL